MYTSTVRTTTCDILIHGAKCDSCHDYRAQLCTMYSRYKKNKRSKSRYVNNRFLTPPLKDEKLQQLQERVSVANKEIKRLNTKLEELLKKSGIAVDTDLHEELLGIMGEQNHSVQQNFPSNSFRRLFWEAQLKAATDAWQMHCHPMIIRRCLNLKLLSSYHSLRTARCIKLASERTTSTFFNLRLDFNQKLIPRY